MRTILIHFTICNVLPTRKIYILWNAVSVPLPECCYESNNIKSLRKDLQYINILIFLVWLSFCNFKKTRWHFLLYIRYEWFQYLAPGRVFVDHTPVGRLQAKTCLINIHALPSASLRRWERRRQSLAWPMAYWQTRCGAICHCCLTVKHILIECPPLTNVQLLITGIRSIACQAENSIPVFHVSNGVLLYTTVKQWTEGSHIDSDNAVRKYARNL